LGIGDWGLGIGPNPQSPIPNPQSPIPMSKILIYYKIIIILLFNISLNKYDKLVKNDKNEKN
jgi:hypothetical protein